METILMARYVALHDRRLNGAVPRRRHLRVVHTNATTALVNAFREIRAEASIEQVRSLFILCHGYAGIDRRARMSMDAGGMGLQLGQENVTQQNVSMWRSIRGIVRNIVIYACAAANTEPDNVGTDADGRYLMGSLALHTGADVYAADSIQWYDPRGGRTGLIDFGGWEGRLLRFTPDGAAPTQKAKAPVELSKVLSGAAI
jgi:hypothetical protein